MIKGTIAEGRALATFWTVLAIVALWTAAASIEITVPLWGKAIAVLGSIQPLPTARVLEITRLHVAWWIAAIGSLLIGILWVKRNPFCASACAAALFVSAIGVSLASLALSLPLHGSRLGASDVNAPMPYVRPHAVKRVNNASGIPGLADRVRGMFGQHFFLDNLPDDARTIETGYDYLIGKTTSRVISETMRAWKEAYGAELQIEYERKNITVFLWGGTADFSSRLVYAVSAPDGYPWQVYLEPIRK
jgi:hypothetical protein